MARLPRSGVTFLGIYERTPETERLVEHGARLREAAQKLSEAGLPHDPLHLRVPVAAPDEYLTTLAEVIADLGLNPLWDEDEQKIREDLGAVIGRGSELAADSKKWNRNNLTVAAVRATLVGAAEGLDAMIAGPLPSERLAEIKKVLSGAETGFRERCDAEVALRIIEALRQEIGDDLARERAINFHKWPRTVAEACRQADRNLDKIKWKSGPQARDWYGGFARVLAFIAVQNGIEQKVAVNPRTGEAMGRFLDMAERFEKLLPRHMRSASRGAIAKTLQRLKM